MKVSFHDSFRKSYRKRIASSNKLIQQTEERISLFQLNSKNPLLRDHGLSGPKKGLRAFSVTGDIRIVYLPISSDEVTFLDIGIHNQVYR